MTLEPLGTLRILEIQNICGDNYQAEVGLIVLISYGCSLLGTGQGSDFEVL